jgi:type II secretory pathway pseudopilin PulG
MPGERKSGTLNSVVDVESSAPRISSNRRSESGDTLIEVLIAVVIIALAATALLGALLTSITSSVSHRSLAVDDSVLRSFAEAAKEQIELQSNPLYVHCPASYSISSSAPPSGYSVPAITQVQYWNGAAFQSGCPPKDLGIQLITATETHSNDHVSQELQFVVRNPSYAP